MTTMSEYIKIDPQKDSIPESELDIIRKNDNWTVRPSKYEGGAEWITISKDLVTRGLVKQYFPRVVSAVEQAVATGHKGIEFENFIIESDDKWGWTKKSVKKSAGGYGAGKGASNWSSGPKGYNILVGYIEGFKPKIDEALADKSRTFKESVVSVVNMGTVENPNFMAYYVVKEEKFVSYAEIDAPKKQENPPITNAQGQ